MPHIYTNDKYATMLCGILTQVAECLDVDGGIFENV
jgi:hypothetical protein